MNVETGGLPLNPVRILVGFAEDGTTDIVSRIVAQKGLREGRFVQHMIGRTLNQMDVKTRLLDQG